MDSLTRGINILKALSEGKHRLSEIAESLNLSKGTVYRFLKSFEKLGVVIQDPLTRLYHLGPMLLELTSQPVVAHQSLVICSSEEMERLRNLTCETVVLYIRVGLRRLCLEQLASSESIKYSTRRGYAAPIYTGSAGKILLSEMKEEEFKVIFKNLNLIALTQNTIVDKGQLLTEIQRAGRLRYATSFGEAIVGAASVSVAIRGYITQVALTVLGPDNRLNRKKIMEILSELKRSSESISNNLKNLS